MKQTRREFLVTTAVVAGGTAFLAPIVTAQPPVALQPAMMIGDAYGATVVDGGFGRRSLDEARQHALRFRSTDSDRDREFLGVEV
jgi:hypothetical protein